MLSTKDFELASLQQKFSGLQAEVLELRRGQRREGVSMDYLKNVVFKVRAPLCGLGVCCSLSIYQSLLGLVVYTLAVVSHHRFFLCSHVTAL